MSKDRLILGTHKGFLKMQRVNGEWRRVAEHLAGVRLSYAAMDPRTGTIWVCADHGHWGSKLYRSRDSGETLEEVAAPVYPEGAVAYDAWEDGKEFPAKVTYIWTMTPGGSDQPGRLYLGTEPGGVFISDDDGDSFQLLDGLWGHESRPKNWFGGGRDQAGACSIVVDPRDSRHLYVGVSVGGVYESTDGGNSWEGRNKGLKACYLPDPDSDYGHDPHCLVASPANPDVLWQQNHCGVFRSTDRGQTWNEISQKNGPVNFGFPIVADEQDTQTAWVVPGISDDLRIAVDGALCVGRTQDGGRTWQELRNGLPQMNCYDITFRHALDISGESLVFGTTTGNLFISDDRGDNWQTISNYLPPIYSVRFG